MSGQTLLSCRTAIVAGLDAKLRAPLKLRAVEPHRGRLSAGELRRLGARAPALLVGCLGWSELAEVAGALEADCQWIAWLVTADQPPPPAGHGDRGEGALVLCNALGVALWRNDWGLDAQYPRDIQARNLYGAEVDQLGVALWSVAWRQRMTLDAGLDPAELADFVFWHAEHDMGPDTPPAIDEVARP